MSAAAVIPVRAPWPPTAVEPAIVGRGPELEALGRWLNGRRPALVEIEGEAGIGKTTLVQAAVEEARRAGAVVLACRPAEAERGIPFAALASLVEPVLADVTGVPRPRLRALEGALRLRDVTSPALDETAVALGTVSVLRTLATGSRVVVAIDDAQWLDASSRSVLTYALRNLSDGDDVAVCFATRVEGDGSRGLSLGGSVVARDAERLLPGPLSVGALHRVVARRLGGPLSRPRMVRLHAVSGGNPLHAIELARVVANAGPHDELLELPPSLAAALRARLSPLAPGTRRLLVAVAAAGSASPSLLLRLGSPAEIDEAVEQGLLVIVDGEVRFSHPLLASTVYGDADELLRARAHARLARLVDSPGARAHHLALAGTGTDEPAATALELAAESACRRGAHSTGAGLFEQAAGLTPVDRDHDHARRRLSAADACARAGEPDRARALLEVMSARPGSLQLEALCRLGLLLDETVGGDKALPVFERVLAASRDPAILSQAHRGLAQSLAYVGDLRTAASHADAAVLAAEAAMSDELLAPALGMQALVRTLSGRDDWHGPLQHALALEARHGAKDLDCCPTACAADIHRLALELDEARGSLSSILARALDSGDVRMEVWSRYGLAAVEIAAGRWDVARDHAEELRDLVEQTGYLRLPALRIAAQLALSTGDVAGARALLAAVIIDAEPAGELHNLRGALQLEGALELSLGDPGRAIAPLRRARLIAEESSVGAASLLVFVLDEVEALVATDDLAAATEALTWFEGRLGSDAASVGPLVGRARATIEAAHGDLDAALRTVERVVADEDDVPLPLERARSRLLLGRLLRRTQQRAAARAMLTDALERFDALGAVLWADRAREDLARIGGRAPSSDRLTSTEERIAALVAEGMTNREVAVALFVTPKTVESALTRVYRKLGVRSRTELVLLLVEGA